MTDTTEACTNPWFEYPITVYPQHTDYAQVVWHGTYLQWMEAARVEALSAAGAKFEDLVRCNCDLPVIELSIQYRQALKMGEHAIAKSRLNHINKIRLHWDQHIYRPDGTPLITAQVVLVAIDRSQGRIIRNFPPQLQTALNHLQGLQ